MTKQILKMVIEAYCGRYTVVEARENNLILIFVPYSTDRARLRYDLSTIKPVGLEITYRWLPWYKNWFVWRKWIS